MAFGSYIAKAEAFHSKVVIRQPGQRAFSESQIDVFGDFGFDRRLSIKEDLGTDEKQSPHETQSLTSKVISPLAYRQLEERLQSRSPLPTLLQSGTYPSFPYVNSAPQSPTALSFPRNIGHPRGNKHFSSKNKDHIQNRHLIPRTEMVGDTLLSISHRLAESLLCSQQHSTSHSLRRGKAEETKGSIVFLQDPFLQEASKARRTPFEDPAEPVITAFGRRSIATTQHEMFKKNLLENAAVLCEE